MSDGDRRAFDGSRRRRVYLFRHGDVSYVTETGTRVRDTRAVTLTPRGRAEADAMAAIMDGAALDRIVTSGLPRTAETASRIFPGWRGRVDERADFEELRSPDQEENPVEDLEALAYAFTQAGAPGARWFDGEEFAAFDARIRHAWAELLADKDWGTIALVAHGGVNRILLLWALDAPLSAFGTFEQDTCCLNVIDVDEDDDGAFVRAYVRMVNFTPGDPAKRLRNSTTLEVLARAYARKREEAARQLGREA